MKSEICAPLEFKGYIHGISTDGLPHTPHFPGVLTPPGQLVSGSVVRGVRSVLVKRACPLSSPWLALVLAVKARVPGGGFPSFLFFLYSSLFRAHVATQRGLRGCCGSKLYRHITPMRTSWGHYYLPLRLRSPTHRGGARATGNPIRKNWECWILQPFFWTGSGGSVCGMRGHSPTSVPGWVGRVWLPRAYSQRPCPGEEGRTSGLFRPKWAT